jgi:hypothetical protein
MEIEDHDIAGPSGDKAIHPISVRFEQDLEVLTKGRRKKRVQSAVFRIQANSCHYRAIYHVADCMTPLRETWRYMFIIGNQ